MKRLLAVSVLALLFSSVTAGPAFKIDIQKRQVKRRDTGQSAGTRRYPGTLRDLDQMARELSGEAKDHTLSIADSIQFRWSEEIAYLQSAYNWAQGLLRQAAPTPNITVDIDNPTYGLLYTGTIYLGSQKQALDLVFDTGSDWLVVESKTCTNCVSTLFNDAASTTFKIQDSKTQQLRYGSATVSGFTGSDTCSLDTTHTIAVKDFEFFLVTKQKGFSSSMDGILGLCRNYTDPRYSEGPLFMSQLQSRGVIKDNILGVYFANMSTQSVMEFGGYSTSYFKSPSTAPFYVRAYRSIYWLMKVDGFRVGTSLNLTTGETAAYLTPNASASIVDTGTSLIYVPNSIWTTFAATFLLANPGTSLQSNGLMIGSCDPDDYESVFLYVNGTYLEMTPEQYILLEYNTGVQNVCILSFISNGQNFWLLGDGFIRNYYTIFDEDNSRIGYAPSVTSTATIEQNGTPPIAIIVASTPSGTDVVDTYHFLPLQIAYISIQTYGFMAVFTAVVLRVLFGVDSVTPIIVMLGFDPTAFWSEFQ